MAEVYFPGLQILKADMVLTHGVEPSVCIIEAIPEPTYIRQPGTLSFVDGGTVINFENAAVSGITVLPPQEDRLPRWLVKIEDRRWKWRNTGPVVAALNQRRRDGWLQEGPHYLYGGPYGAQDLLVLLLDYIGETGYDVSQVPNTISPRVNWDHVSVTEALGDLVSRLGMYVCLRLDGTIAICPPGVGNDLPALPGAQRIAEYLWSPQDIPNQITLIGGPTIVESKFWLTPVIWDTDAGLKRLSQVSWPMEQLGFQEPVFFTAVPATTLADGDSYRTLAFRYLYRLYKIYFFADLTTRIRISLEEVLGPGAAAPGQDIILEAGMDQVLPLVDHKLINVGRDEITGRHYPPPGYVQGVFYDGQMPTVGATFTVPAMGTTLGPARYTGNYSLDLEQGLVYFDEPVNRLVGYFRPAYLFLTACHHIYETTGTAHRYRRVRQVGGTGNPLVVKREDLILAMWNKYEISNDYNARASSTGVVTNAAIVNPEADAYLDILQAMFSLPGPHLEMMYLGFTDIELSGNVHQVQWHIGRDGAYTRGSRNFKFCLYDEVTGEQRLDGQSYNYIDSPVARQRHI